MKLDSRALQEYLEELARHSQSPDGEVKARELLRAYAELRYKMHGGRKCSLCGASVRHVYLVTVEYDDRSTKSFDCLCTRCLEGERGQSVKITLSIGDKATEYPTNGRQSNKSEKKHFHPPKTAHGGR